MAARTEDEMCESKCAGKPGPTNQTHEVLVSVSEQKGSVGWSATPRARCSHNDSRPRHSPEVEEDEVVVDEEVVCEVVVDEVVGEVFEVVVVREVVDVVGDVVGKDVVGEEDMSSDDVDDDEDSGRSKEEDDEMDEDDDCSEDDVGRVFELMDVSVPDDVEEASGALVLELASEDEDGSAGSEVVTALD